LRSNRAPLTQRIVLTGPESTGKSLLTDHLAQALGLPAAQEYARAYLEQHGPSYDYDLLLELSRRHLAYQQEKVPDAAPAGILDTDFINYKIWCEVVYGRCHDEILAHLEAERDHAYLLCYPDVPWEYDPLRESRDRRMELFDLHRREIERLGRPYIIIQGLGPQRFARAEAAACRLLHRAPPPSS
jgi:nicotinamide riboside kinase